MNTIKFSHNYLKLTAFGKKCTLLQIVKVHYKDLSKEFIDFDTKYLEGQFKNYALPKTELILMIFMNERKKLITTIRRYTPQKFSYYKELEGKDFEIMMEGKDVTK